MSAFEIVTFIFSLILSVGIIYFALSVRKFSAEFTYMKLRLGKPVRWGGRNNEDGVKKGGGVGIVWAIIESVYVLPNVVDRIELDSQRVTTREREIRGKHFSAIANMEIKPIFYFTWPNDFESMKQAYVNAPPPGLYPGAINGYQRERIKMFVQEAIEGAVRRVLGNESWYEITTGKSIKNKTKNGSCEINKLIDEEVLKNKFSPVAKAGWKDVYVEISKVDIPPEIGKAMSDPQIASYQGDAKRNIADAIAYEKVKIADATAYEKDRVGEAIKRLGEVGDRIYSWDKLVETAQGESNTILMQIPESITRFIEQKTGISLSEREVNLLAQKLGE